MTLWLAILAGSLCPWSAEIIRPPLSDVERTQMNGRFDQQIADLTTQITQMTADLKTYSERGTLYFYRGKFAESLADYDHMVKSAPKLAKSHWQRGIVQFFIGDFEACAQQFAKYDDDQGDRESALWRFLALTKLKGIKVAQAEMVQYQHPDARPVMERIYEVYAGRLHPNALLQSLRRGPTDERLRQLFYADLYIGLLHVVTDRPELAKTHLSEAINNSWPQGVKEPIGPRFMWHVARVQYDLLLEGDKAAEERARQGADGKPAGK